MLRSSWIISPCVSMMAGLDMPTEGSIAFDGDSLDTLDLDSYRRESISMIFQAFQQRVAIARSLSAGAKLILADEPTGNLDVANSKKVMDILHSLAHDEGYCVIVVTHDMDIAKAADIVFRMKDGVLT